MFKYFELLKARSDSSAWLNEMLISTIYNGMSYMNYEVQMKVDLSSSKWDRFQ